MFFVPGNELNSIQPGNVTDPAGTLFPWICVDGFPCRLRRPGQTPFPVNQNRARSSQVSFDIFEEQSQNVSTGAADRLRVEITSDAETRNKLDNCRLPFFFDWL